MLVTWVSPVASAGGVLLPGDVITQFDGAPIASDGTTPFRTGERIMFSYLISQRFVGDMIKVRMVLPSSRSHRLGVCSSVMWGCSPLPVCCSDSHIC